MGNQSAKEGKNTLLSDQETAFVGNSFKNLSRNHEKLKSDDLVKAWSNLADAEFVGYVKDCLFRSGNAHQSAITIKPYMEHYYVAVKGSLYEQSNYINTRIFGNPPGVEGSITSEDLLKLVSAIVRSYFMTLDHNKTRQYKSWLDKEVSVNRKDIDNYAQFLLKNLMNVQPISLDDVENWLHINPLWTQMWKSVVVFLYSQKVNPASILNSVGAQPKTLPLCEVPPNTDRIRSILDVGKIMFINDQLPPEYRHKWRFLFNSQIHGESFATFLGKVTNKGPTILILEDEHQHIFGGFAPESWSLSPKFQGDETTMLFTLQPTMQCFISSGYNDHFQYLNTHQQTMPNGLGMGGQFNYWGLWLDYEYGIGQSSESCTTFKNFVKLSAQKNFTVRNLEVWAVGEEPVKDENEREHGSVLDKNQEEKAMLELAGRKLHSEGLREADPDLDR